MDRIAEQPGGLTEIGRGLSAATTPGPNPRVIPPGREERNEVKKVAKLLLKRLKALLVLDWRRQNGARARVRLAIEDALDEGLPRAYTPDVFQQKCQTLFEHVFESYGGAVGKRAGEAA